MTYIKKSYYTTANTTKGLDGNYYASMFEASYGNELFARKQNKEIESYDTQVTFPIMVNGYKICSYIADFVIYHLDGSNEIAETKGFATDVFKIKWKLIEAIYSKDYKMTLLQQQSSWGKNTKSWGKKWQPKVIEY